MRYDKIKTQFEPELLDGLLDDENSCVRVYKKHKEHVTLLPYHLNNINDSLKSILDLGISKYNKTYNGVLLGHKNVKVLPTKSVVNREYVYIHVDVEADFYIFKPEVDRILNGVVNKCNPGHVGALIYNTFNVSIPKPTSDDATWLGSQVSIGQEVELRINLINYEARLPFIKAELISIKENTKLDTTSEPDDLQVKKKKKKKKSKDLCEDSVDNDPAEESIDRKVKKHNKKIGEETFSMVELNYTDENGVEEVKSSKKSKSKREKSFRENDVDAAPTENFEDVPKKKKRKSTVNNLSEEEGEFSGTTKIRNSFCEGDLEVTESKEDVMKKKKKKKEKGEYSLIKLDFNYENDPSLQNNKGKHRKSRHEVVENNENAMKNEEFSFDSDNPLNLDDLLDNTNILSTSNTGMIDDDVKKLKIRRNSIATDHLMANFKKDIIYDSEIENIIKDADVKSEKTKKRKRSSLVDYDIKDVKTKMIKTEY